MSELEIWNELGNIYYNTGAYDESIRAYNKAIELDQGCEQSYSNLASIYVNQGCHEEAVSLLQKGIELLEEATDKALLWNRLGEVYRKLDDYDNALAAYQKAVELDPDNVIFQDNLAKAEPDSAHIIPENNVESSETVTEAENRSRDFPVARPTCRRIGLPGVQRDKCDRTGFDRDGSGSRSIFHPFKPIRGLRTRVCWRGVQSRCNYLINRGNRIRRRTRTNADDAGRPSPLGCTRRE